MNEEEQKYFKGLIGFTFDSDDIRYIEKIVDKKDKKIERLNENNQAMQEEMARTWKKLDEKENIIKEVREYIEENTKEGPIKDKRYLYSPEQANDILEILDKVGDENE